MTATEFKAWFEGFTEAIDGTPSPEQWERIKQRVAEIRPRAFDAGAKPSLPDDRPWRTKDPVDFMWRGPIVTFDADPDWPTPGCTGGDPHLGRPTVTCAKPLTGVV